MGCLWIPLPLSTPYPQRQKTVTLGGSENLIPPLLIEPNLETTKNIHSERQNRGEKESVRGSQIGDQHKGEKTKLAKKKKSSSL